MFTLGRTLLILGFAITALALVYFVFGHIEFPRGSTIGDWEYRNNNVHVYVPIVGCLVVSGVLTLAFWIARRR
jgi:hypothetical protein